jgi:hypothetical protein
MMSLVLLGTWRSKLKIVKEKVKISTPNRFFYSIHQGEMNL